MTKRFVAFSTFILFVSTGTFMSVESASSAGMLVRVEVAQSASNAAAPVEPWQRSWDAYVDAYNECVKNSSCKPATRFGKKRVQWEATLVELDLKRVPPSVILSLNSTKAFNVSKPPAVFKVIAPEMRTSEIEVWKTLQPGSAVRFDAMIEEGGGILALFGQVGSRFQDAFPLLNRR